RRGGTEMSFRVDNAPTYSIFSAAPRLCALRDRSFKKPAYPELRFKAVAEIALEFQAGEGTYVFRVPASKLEETWNDIALKPADLVEQGSPDALDKITQVRVHLTKKLDQSASVVICAASTDADRINQSATPR
ncbi:MAG: hypothetical protein ACYC26_11515, partial [Phycisphaerales bacterium]